MAILVSAVVRVAVTLWVINMLSHAFEDKEQRKIRELREHIERVRKWKERIDSHVIRMESKYAELVS